MTDANTLLSLAARVEAAAGADRVLDGAIFQAISPGVAGELCAGIWCAKGKIGFTPPPAFTASFDAAMKLVYEDGGGLLLSLSDIGADGLPMAVVTRTTERVDQHAGIARTLVRSIAAAALRARAAQMGVG